MSEGVKKRHLTKIKPSKTIPHGIMSFAFLNWVLVPELSIKVELIILGT